MRASKPATQPARRELSSSRILLSTRISSKRNSVLNLGHAQCIRMLHTMNDTNQDSPATFNAARYLPLLLLLFAGSGCSALIYEIVWYQLLQLTIGSTTVSLA